MKITIVLDYLVFEKADEEIVLDYTKEHGLDNVFYHKGKIHVKATKEELFLMLFELSTENDIDLI